MGKIPVYSSDFFRDLMGNGKPCRNVSHFSFQPHHSITPAAMQEKGELISMVQASTRPATRQNGNENQRVIIDYLNPGEVKKSSSDMD
jgi:hypothetical protein